VYRCWVSYDTDRALQKKVNQGWYGDKDSACVPISGFPAPPSNSMWIALIHTWSKERGVELLRGDDGLTWTAKVKQRQIADFIEYVYGSDPSYNDPAKMLTWQGRAYLANALTNLRAFVAQDLNPRLWYVLSVGEF